MQKVRQNYLDILIDIANSNLLESILRDVTGDRNLTINKLSNDLHRYMIDADYALS